MSKRILKESHDRMGYNIVKRGADVVFSAAALIVLALPIALAAIAIKLETPGPSFVIQQRVGKGGRSFPMIKLRTMKSDALNIEAYFTLEQKRIWEREHKLIDDPRITRIGHFLRTTSFDEVPQFLNVLMGQMSLVGPRPIFQDELDWYGDDGALLLSIRPGLTGLWQVTKRNDATFESGEHQALDLQYIRKRTLLLDIWIILRTFRAIALRTGL